MAYFIIEEELVYMPDNRRAEILEEQGVEDYNGIYIAVLSGNRYERSPEQIKHDTIIYDYLKNKYSANKDSFLKDWVEINLEGEEAQNNVWDLLNDNCLHYGRGFLVEFRDEFEPIMEESFSRTSTCYLPMGEVFALTVKAKPIQLNMKTVFKDKFEMTVVINANKVIKIEGRIHFLNIYFENGSMIRCSENITVRPF